MDEKYFIVKIQFETVDIQTGKTKKTREEKLVRGYNVTDVEAKVTKLFEKSTEDWRITSATESKINEVIEK
jgi:hypothetical protein